VSNAATAASGNGTLNVQSRQAAQGSVNGRPSISLSGTGRSQLTQAQQMQLLQQLPTPPVANDGTQARMIVDANGRLDRDLAAMQGLTA
jgi:hypothetical protein